MRSHDREATGNTSFVHDLVLFGRAIYYGWYDPHSFRFLFWVAYAELRRIMDLKLIVLEGKNAGKEIAIQGGKFLIGRSEDCQLRPGSDLISRHHCALLVEEGYIGIRDFGSKNGTFVNDERVVGERELKPGDRLTIGPLRFEVHVAHGLAAKKRAPVIDVKDAIVRTAHDAAQSPVDVTQWISAEQQDQGSRVTDPPASKSLNDTDAIQLSTTQTLTPETVASETEPPSETKSPAHPGKKTPGKLPPIANSSKDSQEAAAAVLNKFRKRR